MVCLIQRVTQAKVTVNNQVIAEINSGLLVLTAFQPNDDSKNIIKMTKKLLNYRLFPDDNDKMNLNVQQIGGDVLLVPQFTLAANTQKGLRPSFSSSAKPAIATMLFDEFVQNSRLLYPKIQTGKFGADMQVSLINNGPVTFWLET
ncbi:MAG TPA: D-tyrosyl-tRNA(Tyr) deacylase [Thiomicrospira sp.]|jgi:D-tyrosyl-tRNA(Tyr) deacylase|nr:D-tyrosyl-tRNA(Tyr) deacylase [Thiomicrospira sp.]